MQAHSAENVPHLRRLANSLFRDVTQEQRAFKVQIGSLTGDRSLPHRMGLGSNSLTVPELVGIVQQKQTTGDKDEDSVSLEWHNYGRISC